MSNKRSRDQQLDHRPPKRPKQDSQNKPSPIEEIHFARQLKQLLSFRQDGIEQLRNGIASFKAFLENILYHKDEDNHARQLSILHEFLASEKPADVTQTEHPFLSQLWQAWSFAQQNHNDPLESAISSILTLLVRTLSGILDFRDDGYFLCRTVLQNQHLRLIKRSLDAPKHKEFLISPALRLLIEVTTFDGGVLAREVYKRREQTFDVWTLRRNLGLGRSDESEEDSRKRPSIRTLTIRYILAHLKYLHEGGKTDLLKNRPLCTSLFHQLRDDPAEVVNELLSVVEQYVCKDDELPRSAKAALLVQQNLERVTEIATRSRDDHPAAEKSFAWLKAVGTIPSYGILRTCGWYPPGTSKVEHDPRNEYIIDLGLDSLDFYDGDGRPDVRNTTLLSWIQILRPHTNTQERELVLLCFTSAPELVTAYFSEKVMQLEPKLTNTWIGYASFLFEVVRLPVPDFLGNEKDWAQLPPQTTVMIESVLPRPLTQLVLTRCLNQNSDLITFFGVRILVLAFQKLADVRQQLQARADAAKDDAHLWREASDRLLTRFIERCPSMKDLIATFRKVPDDDEHALQREAIMRLLRLYYEVAPLQAMEEQLDISTSLTAALLRTEAESEGTEVSALQALELEHLLQIARYSPGMRWFSKQGSLEFSPLMTLLKIHAKDHQNQQIRDLITHVLLQHDVINNKTAGDALVASLINISDFADVGAFLDDCFVRVTRKPVKYVDDLDAIAHREDAEVEAFMTEQQPSLLVAVLLEQAPFVLERPAEVRKQLTEWINLYLELLLHNDEKNVVPRFVQTSLAQLDGFTWEDRSSDAATLMETVRFPEFFVSGDKQAADLPSEDETIPFAPPAVELEDHPELLKWARKEIDTALEDGDVAALILCLCSQFPDVRKQALVQLHKLESELSTSTLEDKDPMYVLFGELMETYEHHCAPKSEALPYLAGTFATNAMRVQMDPTYFMYPKINKYLNKGPEWRIHKLPTYWLDNTISAMPEQDDAYWKEATWVLEWLIDGLRVKRDFEILRKAGVFEKMMSLYASPGAAPHQHIREKVLELLWRATFIDGGSTTLVTRTGALSWLEAVQQTSGRLAEKLRRRILQTCDGSRIEEWSGLKIDEL